MKRWIVPLTFTPLLLAGCSQIDALQPVSGVPITSVQIAASEVLVEQKVPLLRAPACTETDAEFTCQGETLAGRPIEVKVVNNDDMPMTITVGGKEIFSGKVQDVLDKSAEVQ